MANEGIVDVAVVVVGISGLYFHLKRVDWQPENAYLGC
jgi:hypothetical protein